ncbi:hypothetical protein GOODEAATRI_005990, partial [Goodea atripinnis]
LFAVTLSTSGRLSLCALTTRASQCSCSQKVLIEQDYASPGGQHYYCASDRKLSGWHTVPIGRQFVQIATTYACCACTRARAQGGCTVH